MADPVPSFSKPDQSIVTAMAALNSALAQPAAQEPPKAPGVEAKDKEPEGLPKRKYRVTRDDLVQHRRLVESRLQDFECRDVLTSGRLTQPVIIHSKLLTVVFQDQLPDEKRETYRVVEATAQGTMERQFMLNMYPVAIGLKTINGTLLPARRANQSFDEWIRERVDYVSTQVSGTWLDLLWHNYNWFLERCSEFTVEELGNG